MRKNFIFIFSISVFILTGCNSVNASSQVSSVIDSQINEESGVENTEADINTEMLQSEIDTKLSETLALYGLSEDNVIPETGDIKIEEELFVTQCINIYNNPNKYEGRTITLEGIYDEYVDPETGDVYYYLYRNSAGCCGDDGSIGFEFMYDGEKPNIGDWIEITGTLEVLRFDSGFTTVVINLSDLQVMDTRGKEFVIF